MKQREWVDDLILVQRKYAALIESKHFTKAGLIDAVKWFRDKYNLKDSDALEIARGNFSLEKVKILIEGE